MDKHGSQILICDQVLQFHSPTEASLLYGIDMMSLFGGKERSLAEWKFLIYSAGANLEVVNVLRSPESEAAILDVRLKF
jgi:NADH:ubiquinone oxidoreductase subunit 4 (subunit M)